MAIIDSQLQFAAGTAWAPTSVGTSNAPNVVDTAPLGGVPTANGGRDLGEGKELFVEITVTQAAAGGVGATVQFELITSASSSLSSPTVLVASEAFPYASLTAGTQIRIPLPQEAGYLEFLGVAAVIGTAALTAGAFQCEIISEGYSANTRYAGGYLVS